MDFVNFILLIPSIEWKDASSIVSILSNDGGEYPNMKPSPTELIFPTVPPSTTLVPGYQNNKSKILFLKKIFSIITMKELDEKPIPIHLFVIELETWNDTFSSLNCQLALYSHLSVQSGGYLNMQLLSKPESINCSFLSPL